MTSTPLPFTFWRDENNEPFEVRVLAPEPGMFTAETVKCWATELLLYEEGIVNDSLSLDEAVRILHKYKFAKIKQ
jgi:hypothetical protein